MGFWLFPAVGGLIGWGTNWLAVRLLFFPVHPWRVPGTPWALQGVLPRRRAELTQALAEVVENHLLSTGQVVEALLAPSVRAHFTDGVVRAVLARLSRSLPAFVPRIFGDRIVTYAEQAVRQEVADLLAAEFPALLTQMAERVDIAAMVRERLDALSMEEIEHLLLRLVAREFRAIELLGAILGAVVGLVQAGLVALWDVTV